MNSSYSSGRYTTSPGVSERLRFHSMYSSCSGTIVPKFTAGTPVASVIRLVRMLNMALEPAITTSLGPL